MADGISKTCSVDGCERKYDGKTGRGLCSMHYRRWRKYGDTGDPPRRHLRQATVLLGGRLRTSRSGTRMRAGVLQYALHPVAPAG